MKIVHVEFLLDVPVDATTEQIKEWVCYQVHQYASISFENPLSEYEIEARRVTVDNPYYPTS